MNNSIFSIDVYKENNMWVFDDSRVGLIKEPFVGGADTFIDLFAKERKEITVIFSEISFPDHTVSVDLVKRSKNNSEGTDYICKDLNHKLWLCPALNLYYPKSPKKIYINFK